MNSERAIKEINLIWTLISAFIKWTFIAAIIGAIGGVIGAVFYISVTHATQFRMEHPWLLALLPIGGVVIAALYRFTKMETKNTNAIIDSIHFGNDVPLGLTPVIFFSTVITHMFGGSAGREGAALQIGGSLGCNIGRLFHLDEKDIRLAILCGMSAVFSALFGTPLTAALFALEVISVGVFYYSGLIPCLVSSVTAFWVAKLFEVSAEKYYLVIEPLTLDIMWRVALLAVVCAAVSALFCVVMHGTEHVIAKHIPNTFLRAAVGGVAIIILTYAVGCDDYNGTGVHIIKAALEEGVVKPDAFFWKLIFTAITLACGFRGGEVVPSFFVGATLGCFVGPLLGLPAEFGAALGLVAVFCGAVNCPIASIALSIELFGATELMYFAVACGISYLLSGYFGLYSSQKIMYSKTRAEFIDIHAK